MHVGTKPFAILFMLAVGTAAAAEPDGELTVSEASIDRLLAAMTLEEKVLLTSGRDAWSTQPIE